MVSYRQREPCGGTVVNRKIYFFRLPMTAHMGATDLVLHAGTAIAAVTMTGQQAFAEPRVDEYGRVWTDYYTLDPAGV